MKRASAIQEANYNFETKKMKTDNKNCNTCASGQENSGTNCPIVKAETCFNFSNFEPGNNYTGERK